MALNDSQFMQYSRQILLPEVGEQGQQTLMNSHLTLVGMGGLGQLCAQYFAAAGIGRLTLIDGDRVELSNLPRQLLFDSQDCGQFKALVAKQKLSSHCAHCHIDAVNRFVDKTCANELLASADLVLDCSDNFETRQQVNASCVALGITNVIASVAHFQGQLMAIHTQAKRAAGCYHCLFPSSLTVNQTCSNTGVLGPMVGTMASMQALLALKICLRIGDNLGYLDRFNGLTGEWQRLRLRRDPHCRVCGH